MKKIVISFLLGFCAITHAVVVDKINISNGTITAYSHGARHSIKAQDYGKAMAKALKENPHARWRSFNIGKKTYTMSHPTAQWACDRLKVC